MPLLAWPWGSFAIGKQVNSKIQDDVETCLQKGQDWAILSSLEPGFSQGEPEARIQIQTDCNTRWEVDSEPESGPVSAQALSIKIPS